MRFRNILAAGLCATTMALAGCKANADRIQIPITSSTQNKEVSTLCQYYYEATTYTESQFHPIDEKITYSRFDTNEGNGFVLSTKTKDYRVDVYFDGRDIIAYVNFNTGKQLYFEDLDIEESRDGVSRIVETTYGEVHDFFRQFDFKGNEKRFKEGNKWFFQALADVKFRKHFDYLNLQLRK